MVQGGNGALLGSEERLEAIRQQFQRGTTWSFDLSEWGLVLAAGVMGVVAIAATWLAVRRVLLVRSQRAQLDGAGLDPAEVDVYVEVASQCSTPRLAELLRHRSLFDRSALSWLARTTGASERLEGLAAVLSLRRRLPFEGAEPTALAPDRVGDEWTLRWFGEDGVMVDTPARILLEHECGLQLRVEGEAQLPGVRRWLSVVRYAGGEAFETRVRVRGCSAARDRQILVDRPQDWRHARLRIAFQPVDEPIEVQRIERTGGRTGLRAVSARVLAASRAALVVEIHGNELRAEESVRLDEPAYSGRFTNLGVFGRDSGRALHVLVPSSWAEIREMRRSMAHAV